MRSYCLFESLESRVFFTVGIPNAPSALAASVASSTSIKLAWHDNSKVENGFDIERSTDDKTFSQIGTAGPNGSSYTSSGLKSGQKYYYRVRAYNAVGDSTYTSVVSATTTAAPTTPTPPPITPPPVTTPPATSSGNTIFSASDWKGINVDTNAPISQVIPVLRNLGVKSIRLWFSIPSWNSFSGQSYIKEAAAYKAAGFKIVMVVESPNVPTFQQAVNYFKLLAAAPDALKSVDLWEIGNEPDRPPFWHGTASQYVNTFLKAAWTVLHPLGEKIAGAGPSWDPNYAQQMVNAGYLNYCDYACFHAYGNSVSDIITHAAQFQKVYQGKPIIISEWNVHTITDPAQWVAALDQIEADIKNVSVANFYYSLMKNTSSVGNSGLLLDNLSPYEPFYDMFKDW